MKEEFGVFILPEIKNDSILVFLCKILGWKTRIFSRFFDFEALDS